MRLRTMKEAAAEFGVTRVKIRNGVLDGRYPSIKVGRYWLVDVDELKPIIEAEKKTGMVRITECAEQIGIKVNTLRYMVNQGYVPCERRGRYYWFNVDAVRAALEKQMKTEQK